MTQNHIVDLSSDEIEEVEGGWIIAVVVGFIALHEAGERLHDTFCKH